MDTLLSNHLSVEPADVKEAVRSAIMDPEMRSNVPALRKYLSDELGLTEDKVEAVVSVARDPATEPKEVEEGEAVNGRDENGLSNGVNGVTKKQPILITDVRAFKASLVASAGARPARDITEYEEIDAKL